MWRSDHFLWTCSIRVGLRLTCVWHVCLKKRKLRVVGAPNRIMRVASAVSLGGAPVEIAALVEVASVVLPLFRPRAVAAYLAMAYAPSFASHLIRMIYAVDARLVRTELVFLCILFVFEHAPLSWAIAVWWNVFYTRSWLHARSWRVKPKKRAVLIPIPNKKLFVLGFDEKRVLTIIGYDVTYEHIPYYDLSIIRLRFSQCARLTNFPSSLMRQTIHWRPLLRGGKWKCSCLHTCLKTGNVWWGILFHIFLTFV